ncbi:MAG: hypothetical protein NT091_05340 [Candidatus Falkowbacteria bacterium]|nr:hypothetical protein [Candidatus Falkowbacteria bacterium]
MAFENIFKRRQGDIEMSEKFTVYRPSKASEQDETIKDLSLDDLTDKIQGIVNELSQETRTAGNYGDRLNQILENENLSEDEKILQLDLLLGSLQDFKDRVEKAKK